MPLLEGESISLIEKNQPKKVSDEELNSRYIKGDVRIITESARYSLAGILTMLQEEIKGPDGKGENRYKLDPEYQRRHRWNNGRKSRLIESFLMNIPVPPVFLYERELARFEVMDGRQRLTALSEFYDDKFQLTELEHWKDLEGRKYSQLPDKIKDGIDRRYISSIILLKETAATEEQATLLKKIVFERLNSGGVKLSSQETRNAIYNGPLNKLCLSLSENAAYKKLWRIPVTPIENTESEGDEEEELPKSGQKMFDKMEDVEMVLRFFAYRQIEKFPSGLNKISTLLDSYLNQGNKFDPGLIVKLGSLFNDTVQFLDQLLDNDAFCAFESEKKSNRPTKIVYDPIMYVSSELNETQRNSIIRRKDELRADLAKMYAQPDNQCR
jgi:hypothetical protein